MNYILLGTLGFAIIHLCDPVALKRLPLAKPIVWLAGLGLLIYSVSMASLAPAKFALPAWANWFGLALLVVSSFLVIMSLFVNLPFRKTYLKSGVGDRLVTTGMYAIVRHPGVLSVTMLLAALVLMSRSQALLIAAPIFVALDVLLVYLQDRYFFRLMFKGYNEYRRQTPMLIPNYRSLKAFINSLRETEVVSNMEEK